MYRYKSVWHSDYPPSEHLEKEVLRGEENDEGNNEIHLCSLNQMDTMGKIF